MLTHEDWVNGAWYKSLLGAPPPANPVRNTKRPNKSPLRIDRHCEAKPWRSRRSDQDWELLAWIATP